MKCEICPNPITNKKPDKIDGIAMCRECYRDVLMLGYYVPEIDDRYNIKPVKPPKHVKLIEDKKIQPVIPNKEQGKPITQSDIDFAKWEMENTNIWKELEGNG